MINIVKFVKNISTGIKNNFVNAYMPEVLLYSFPYEAVQE